MKSRRLAIGAFFVAVVLCLTVGYALVTDTLDIQGVANVNADETTFDGNVIFESVAKNADSDEIILNSTKDKADFTTRSLTKKDDESVYDLVIRNDNDFPVTVTPKLVSNNNNEYFEISSDWMDAQGNSQPKEIPANSILPYKLTIKLIKMPTSVQTTSVSIELTVTGEQPQNP